MGKLIMDGAILFLLLGVVSWVSACGGDGATGPPPPPPNRAPTAIGTIPDQTVLAGETVTIDIRSFFSDPDGDPLTYSATTSSAGIASPTIVGSSLTIAGVTPGSATITVTARDPGGLAATQSLAVSVERPNRPPMAVGEIPALSVESGQTARVALSGYFTDPDGDTLTYTPATSNPGIASPTISDSTLTIAGVAQGTATITVEARDPAGLSAQQSVAVTVERPNQAPVPVDSIVAQVLNVGDTVTMNVSSYFRDPDGDVLTYTAVSSAATVALAEVSGSTLTIAGVAPGTATVTVQARDPGGLSAEQGTQVTVVNPDRAALVALYNATDGPDWKRSDNWLTDAPLEAWYGVNMDSEGRVQSLDLSINDLAGRIPSDLGNLSNLTRLGLIGNRLTGSIPRALGKLTRLTTLLLSENQLAGPIPSDLGNLNKLTRLWLSENSLTGTIPAELGNLTDLEELWLGGNLLTGTIPKELGNLSNLTHLRLPRNRLIGAIPAELGNLASLTDLFLFTNRLAGAIPPELGNLAGLEYLGLGGNDLRGPIPPQLGSLASLESLALSGNNLTGAIPSELGNLTSLRTFYVNDNDLSGPLPISLAALQSVTAFHYRNTDLCVPASDSLRAWLDGISSHQGTGVDCEVPSFPAPTVQVGAPARVHLSHYFDQDGAGNLTYSAVTSDQRVALVAVNQDWLWIDGVSEGAAEITVTASSPGGVSAMQDASVGGRFTRIAIFDIAVNPAPTHESSNFKLPESEGTISRSNVFLKGSGDDEYCHAESLTAAWRITHFFGEPIVNGSYKWEGAEDCRLSPWTVLWVRISRPGTSDHYYVKIDPTIPRAGRGFGFNVAGSPNWNDFMCTPEKANEPDRLFTNKEGKCLSEADAKDWYRNGFVDYFHMGWETR